MRMLVRVGVAALVVLGATNAVAQDRVDPLLGGIGRIQMAQSCPARSGYLWCGYVRGSCRYCYTSHPYFCSSTLRCYNTERAARAACGGSWSYCAGQAR